MAPPPRASTCISPTCSPICGACCSEAHHEKSPLSAERSGRAPGRSQAGPRPLGGPADVPIGRGVVMTEVKVPDIGDFKDVAVIEVLVKPGESVSKEQSLITLESDKATMEIPSPGAGVVKELRVKVGDKVSKGS